MPPRASRSRTPKRRGRSSTPVARPPPITIPTTDSTGTEQDKTLNEKASNVFYFMGTQNFHFFDIVAPYVDRGKAPGESFITPYPTFSAFLTDLVTLKLFWATPNGIWCLMAVLIYVLFPYNLSPEGAAAAGPLTVDFFKERLPLWLTVILGYNGFWYFTLISLEWGKRPFIPNREIPFWKVMHNLFYNLTGIIIWTGFENVFCFLWASGRLSYLADSEMISLPFSDSWKNILCTCIGIAIIPSWRDFHFYFAHRLLHFRPMYQQVHSLHHRNTDVEPFSGMCMHPVEHLYYYACILPNLLPGLSPLIFLFNGVHLVLAPGASHSGFEDHWQADYFHYIHHRYFELNYAGVSAAFLDHTFGSAWWGGWKGGEGGKKQLMRIGDEKATLDLVKSPPSFEFLFYVFFAVVVSLGLWISAATGVTLTFFFQNNALFSNFFPTSSLVFVDRLDTFIMNAESKWKLSLLAGCGPAVFAFLFAAIKDGSSLSVGSFIKPFDRRPAWETLLHLTLGVLFCPLPIAVACYWAIQ